MQMNRLWPGVVLASILMTNAHAGASSPRRPERIRSPKYGFSVAFPQPWYVWRTGEGLPVFFNYRPQDQLPQGRLPPHGASIALVACRLAQYVQDIADVSSCAAQSVRGSTGGSVSVTGKKSEIAGPVSGAMALRTDCDEPVYGEGEEDVVHLVVVFWLFHGRAFGAELEYFKSDPDGPRYERALLEIVRSLKPL